MSTSKATPGPWKAQKNHTTWSVFGCDGWPICSFYSDTERADADARLIAAAPELRDALEMVLGCYQAAMYVLGRRMQDFDRSTEVVTARALLARLDAEGK